MAEFKEGAVGAKSRNIANLRGKLPDWVRLPPAVTVPFGSFEKVRIVSACARWGSRDVCVYVVSRFSCRLLPVQACTLADNRFVQALEDSANAALKREMDATLQRLKALPKHQLSASTNGNGNGASSSDSVDGAKADGPAQLLARCRELAMQIQVPEAVRDQLAVKMAEEGIPVPDSQERWGAALQALKGVWASKYNDRAFYSLRKCGIDADDVRMAVCVMRVVPARYAFVIHTKNPQTNDSSEVSGCVTGCACACLAHTAHRAQP